MPVSTLQLHFDYILPPDEWLDIDDTAKAIGMGKRFTEYALADGQIGSHEHNSKLNRKKEEDGIRMTKRIPRYWVEGYLVKSATYDGQMKLQLGHDVVAAFKGDRESLIQLRRHIDQLLLA